MHTHGPAAKLQTDISKPGTHTHTHAGKHNAGKLNFWVKTEPEGQISTVIQTISIWQKCKMANSEVFSTRISSISLLIPATALFGIKCKNMRIMSLLQPVQQLRNLNTFIF